jgi:DNA-binding LacI/PurR family transcriptional regulator
MPAPAALKENSDRSPSVSIRDVARAAGVSYQTVSRVINESSSVKSSTRESVLDAIARLGFRPNRAARALAGGPVQSVTVLTSNTSLYGQSAALEGIEEATREAGFAMGVRVIEHGTPADVRDAVERALEPAGALIVIAFDRPGLAALDCVPSDVPVIAMIPPPVDDESPPRPAVWIDEYAAAKEATEYLLSLGHKTVHHLSIPTWTGDTRRMSGWRSALEQAGVAVPKPLLSGWGAEWGYEMGQKLAQDPKVTALLCGNDDIALGVLRAMHEGGRPVPADVSIVGFDDVPFARFLHPDTHNGPPGLQDARQSLLRQAPVGRRHKPANRTPGLPRGAVHNPRERRPSPSGRGALRTKKEPGLKAPMPTNNVRRASATLKTKSAGAGLVTGGK